MSENDAKASEVTTEKEIIINLEEKNDTKNDNISEPVNDEQPKRKAATKFVERKQIVDLTDDEKAIIVANARNNYDQPYYDVKLFKNGKYRIIKKKEQAQTVAQKVITSTTTPEKEKKVFYSDNQLLFEHVIELNAKVEKLMAKHKKLKRRYQTLQNDIYCEDDEVSTPREFNSQSDGQIIENHKPEPKNEVVTEPKKEVVTEQQQTQPPLQQPIYNKRMNWRTRLSYL